MLKQSVIDNWAVALVDIAIETKKQKEFIDQSNTLVEVLKNAKDFVNILSARLTSEEDDINKDKIIDETFTKFGFNKNIVNAMKLLANECSFEYARPIFKTVRKNLQGMEGIEYGVAWSTVPLKPADIKTLETKISKKLGTKIILVNKIDDQLIGGVQVIVAKRLFDGSVKGQLQELKYTVLQNNIK